MPFLMIISKKCNYSTCLLIDRVRYGACEIHTVAAFMGGIASQEAIKILTRQYVPLHQTFIYNGLQSVSGVFNY